MPPSKLAPLREMTALVAEDDDVMRASLARTLKGYFQEVLDVATGRHALALFDCRAVHLALLDISMPGMSGLEVAAAIREQDPDFPILILTCHEDAAYMRQAVQLRLMDYLLKPLDLDMLEDVLMRCLAEMRRRNRLEVPLSGGTLFNPATGTAFRQGRCVPLTRNEQCFLSFLAKNRGTAIVPERLCRLLGAETQTEFSLNALRNLVYRLRSKIGVQAVVCNKDSGYMLP